MDRDDALDYPMLYEKAADEIERLKGKLAEVNKRLRYAETVIIQLADMTEGAQGASYCPYCGAPDAEHKNGVCPRFPPAPPPK